MAEQAIALWAHCEMSRRAKINQIAQERFFRKAPLSDLVKHGEQIEIPPPKKYPVDFDEFLRLTVGGRYKAHRIKIYRDYIKDMIWLGHVFNHQYVNRTAVMSGEEAKKLAEPASLSEIENWIKSDGDSLIESEGLYFQRASAFLDWRSKQPSERGRKAAAARWKKQKQ
jgi:hypothetical protein